MGVDRHSDKDIEIEIEIEIETGVASNKSSVSDQIRSDRFEPPQPPRLRVYL